MSIKNVFIKNSDLSWETVAVGVRRKIMAYDDKLMLVKVAFSKDAIGALHHHYHSQITHVESGVFEVIVDGKKKILRGGDAFHIPSDVVHGCVCLEEGVLIDAFSPMREDFLK
ncbi:MAG: cupin domain-containing protein [Saprospiraceae bacterium]|nr:cupin domain-containing protein [Saprospiraceae bacterium]